MADDQKKTAKLKNEDNKTDNQPQAIAPEMLKKECDEYKTKYLRALADYQNLEKRIYQEKEETRKYANSMLILELLPFLDHLEKAEAFIRDPGLQMIKESFIKLLKKIGLEEIEVLHQTFDPNLAEAVDIVAGEKDNIVIEVVRKGYCYHGKVLRIAQVKVTKKS